MSTPLSAPWSVTTIPITLVNPPHRLSSSPFHTVDSIRPFSLYIPKHHHSCPILIFQDTLIQLHPLKSTCGKITAISTAKKGRFTSHPPSVGSALHHGHARTQTRKPPGNSKGVDHAERCSGALKRTGLSTGSVSLFLVAVFRRKPA